MSEMVQIETYLQWKINWKLYVACWMAHYQWHWMNLKVTFAVWNLASTFTSCIIYDMFTHE